MQRFGSSSISTFHVGRALLQNNWEEAIDLIMKPRPGGSYQYIFIYKLNKKLFTIITYLI